MMTHFPRPMDIRKNITYSYIKNKEKARYCLIEHVDETILNSTYVAYQWCGHGRSKQLGNYLCLSKGCCTLNTASLSELGLWLVWSC